MTPSELIVNCQVSVSITYICINTLSCFGIRQIVKYLSWPSVLLNLGGGLMNPPSRINGDGGVKVGGGDDPGRGLNQDRPIH